MATNHNGTSRKEVNNTVSCSIAIMSIVSMNASEKSMSDLHVRCKRERERSLLIFVS